MLPGRNVVTCPVHSLASYLIMRGLPGHREHCNENPISKKALVGNWTDDPVTGGHEKLCTDWIGFPLLRPKQASKTQEGDFAWLKRQFEFAGTKVVHMGRNMGQRDCSAGGIHPGEVGLHAKMINPGAASGSKVQADHYLLFSITCVCFFAVEMDDPAAVVPDTGEIPRFDAAVQPSEEQMRVFMELLMPGLGHMLEEAQKLKDACSQKPEAVKKETCYEARTKVPLALRYLVKHFVLACASRPLVKGDARPGTLHPIDYEAKPFYSEPESPLYQEIGKTGLWETDAFIDVLKRVQAAEDKRKDKFRAGVRPAALDTTTAKICLKKEIDLQKEVIQQKNEEIERLKATLKAYLGEQAGGGGEPVSGVPKQTARQPDGAGGEEREDRSARTRGSTSDRPEMTGNWNSIASAFAEWGAAAGRGVAKTYRELEKDRGGRRGKASWRSGNRMAKIWCNWGPLFLAMDDGVSRLMASRGDLSEKEAKVAVVDRFSSWFKEWAKMQRGQVKVFKKPSQQAGAQQEAYTTYLLEFIQKRGWEAAAAAATQEEEEEEQVAVAEAGAPASQQGDSVHIPPETYDRVRRGGGRRRGGGPGRAGATQRPQPKGEGGGGPTAVRLRPDLRPRCL